jgi:dual specificity phosphatase 12
VWAQYTIRGQYAKEHKGDLLGLEMSYIIDRLYLGDIDDAYKSTDLIETKGVTHLLTIDSKPLSVEARHGFIYLHVHALDTNDFDLLRELDTCIQFIDEGRKNGAVLVHCWAGQSRSAAVVLAYVMKFLRLSPSEADELVRAQRPVIKPNDGFMRQLELFHEMNYDVDLSYPTYRKYRLDILAEQMQKDFRGIEVRCQSDLDVTSVSARVDRRLPYCPGGQMSQVRLYDSLPTECFTADPLSCGVSADDTVYRCAKCRRPLFRQSGVMSHEVCTSSKAQFKGHRSTADRKPFSGVGNICDVFVEPVAWMTSMILTIEGKLTCPKCSAKIGSFNWAGEPCPCGTWVTPAFHVQKSKVDACRSVAVPNAHRSMSSPPTGVLPQPGDHVDKQRSPAGLIVMDSPDGLSFRTGS